ncbi:MAG: hypothetical protein F2934_00310 [Actinobacteria bacterium]|nr:hypothetical protein [Actinomycetota bacterium]MSY12145.1 hypothetical protein [Actinomycetota bacterium]MSZ04339.1 hypothetical protein [Actinomycetota bacterium]MTB05556.1 hypothetical protein [Actinomycetota bacterium]
MPDMDGFARAPGLTVGSDGIARVVGPSAREGATDEVLLHVLSRRARLTGPAQVFLGKVTAQRRGQGGKQTEQPEPPRRQLISPMPS